MEAVLPLHVQVGQTCMHVDRDSVHVEVRCVSYGQELRANGCMGCACVPWCH